jgi:hypothetical protein
MSALELGRHALQPSISITNTFSRQMALFSYLKRTVDAQGNAGPASEQYVFQSVEQAEPEPEVHSTAIPDYMLPMEIPADRRGDGERHDGRRGDGGRDDGRRGPRWSELDMSCDCLVPIGLSMEFPFFGDVYRVAYVSQDG